MLTNIAIKALKPATKPYKRSYGGGLFILVQPNGGKTWRFACQSAFKVDPLIGA